MLLHPNELRARREVLRMALKRLLDGFQADRRWTRRELFESPSAQSHQLNWQRNVLRVLMERKLVSRIGPVKKPVYTVNEADGSVQQLTALTTDVQALEQLLRERFEYGNREIDDEDTSDIYAGDDSESELDTDIDPLQAILQLLYATSESVIYIREAVDDCRERLARLEAQMTSASAEPLNPSTANPNGTCT